MVDLKLNALELQQARLNELAEGLTSHVAVVLEGRDTAGKSGTIRALTQYLPPRLFSVVMSAKPSKSTMENWWLAISWCFQRYFIRRTGQ